jgi:hypothetical protein
MESRQTKQQHGSSSVSLISIVLLASLIASLTTVFVQPYKAQAAGGSFADQTRVGIHNAYDKARFKYLINALQAGSGLVEVDVWQNWFASGKYWTSDNGFGNNNNCEDATSYSQLGSLNRNQDFTSCLQDISLWQQQFPNHAPLILKLELKNGFDTANGYGPAQLDAMLKSYIGANNLYTPADLMGSTYGDLDSAARANAWATTAQLTGKIIVVIQAGAPELRLKSYTSDQEYIDYLISLKKAGHLSQATAFPTLLKSASTDPRPNNDRAPWYVVFGDDATNWTTVDTSFYANNHYLLIMTKANEVAPSIDSIAPAAADAYEHVNQIAAHAATIASVDWTDPTLLAYTTSRSHLTYEAEASTNTLAGGAVVQSCTGCSGGSDVGYIGMGGTLQFNNIIASSAGTYTVTIWYANGDSATRTASLSVNGGTPTTLSFAVTGNVNVVNVVTTTIPLNAGSNTLLFSNSAAWGPDIDGVAIQ